MVSARIKSCPHCGGPIQELKTSGKTQGPASVPNIPLANQGINTVTATIVLSLLMVIVMIGGIKSYEFHGESTQPATQLATSGGWSAREKLNLALPRSFNFTQEWCPGPWTEVKVVGNTTYFEAKGKYSDCSAEVNFDRVSFRMSWPDSSTMNSCTVDMGRRTVDCR
jgi:hypothetical protein